jgi:hypothetical protein
MKLMEIYNMIVEGSSSEVFHKTYLQNILSILKSDEIRLSSVAGSGADRDKNAGRMFFLSTARSRSSTYFRSVGDYTVLLTLDGRKLNNLVKSVPVDYWGYQNKLDVNGSDEMEDRFVSDKQTIPNASKYITKIEILLPNKREKKIDYIDRKVMLPYSKMSDEEIEKARGAFLLDTINPREAERLRHILLIAKRKSIPVFVYVNEKAFRYGKNAMSIPIPIDKLKGRSEYPDRGDRGRLWSSFTRWYDLYYKDDVEDLDYETKNMLRYIVSGHNSEYIRSLQNDIHNDRNGSNRYVNRLIKMVQKHGGTVKSFVEYLADKWKGKLNV